MESENTTLLTGPPYWNNTMLFKSFFNIIFSPITIFTSVLGVIGNGLVVWYLSFKIKRTASSIYIFNLAVADSALLLFAIVFHIFGMIFALMPHLESKYEDEHVIKFIGALYLACLFGYNTSLCLLTAISIERCLSVLFPIWYYCNRPRHTSSIVCSLIWSISCILCGLEFAFCYNTAYNRRGILKESTRECKIMFVVICSFSFAIFIPSMIVSSFVLLIKVWASSQHRQPKKIYVVIALTVFFFLVFGMPMRVLLLAWYKHHAVPSSPTMNLFALFCSINSTINPFIYFLVGRHGYSGKITLLSVLQAVFRDDWNQPKRKERK
ncbi:proto-oncogene Mas-like [Leptodactylus fuscus]|uniref:proto-oncogene Mas-like n=1 Tax=Leptodactylus fuscus TaxID=238119 RepID=UPI003F4E919A